MIEDFAKSLSLNTWDWVAVMVALFSLIVAVKSYFIALQTLKSQRETAENTLPLLTKKRQYEVFRSIEKRLVDNYINALCVLSILENKGRGVLFSYLEINYFKIDLSEIHLELFYEDESNVEMPKVFDNKSAYVKLYDLTNSLNLYNEAVSKITNRILNGDITESSAFDEFKDFVLENSLDLLIKLSGFIVGVYGEKMDVRNYIIRDIYSHNAMGEDYTKDTYWPGQDNIIKNKYIDSDKWDYLFDDYNISNDSFTIYIKYTAKFDISKIASYLTNAACSKIQRTNSRKIYLFINDWLVFD